MKIASDWISAVSEGKVRLNWTIYDGWVRMPGTSQDYLISKSGSAQAQRPDIVNFWQKAISATDKLMDLSQVQAVHFILPKGQRILGEAAKGYAWDSSVSNFVTKEGTHIGFFTVPGVFYDNSSGGYTYWSLWVKEYVRGLGAPGLSAQDLSSPTALIDINGGTEGERELSGWIRFLFGWLSENQIYCQDIMGNRSINITLSPLSSENHDTLKMAIFKISDSKVLVLESRRVTKFSCTTHTVRDGVLAYIFDSTLGNGQEYFKAISPQDRAVEQYSCTANNVADPLLHEGDKIEYEGLSVEVKLHGDYDLIKITRS